MAGGLRYLIPRFPARTLGAMLGWAACGALVAGVYGIVHDQVSYTLGPEYFTAFKFHQFAWADPGVENPRVFVAIVGFLATWWVGLIAGWVLARCGLGAGQRLPAGRLMARGFLNMTAVALLFSLGGYGYGLVRTAGGAPPSWQVWEETLGLVDTAAFARVGYLHNASYLGGLVGLIIAAVLLKRAVRRETREPAGAAGR